MHNNHNPLILKLPATMPRTPVIAQSIKFYQLLGKMFTEQGIKRYELEFMSKGSKPPVQLATNDWVAQKDAASKSLTVGMPLQQPLTPGVIGYVEAPAENRKIDSHLYITAESVERFNRNNAVTLPTIKLIPQAPATPARITLANISFTKGGKLIIDNIDHKPLPFEQGGSDHTVLKHRYHNNKPRQKGAWVYDIYVDWKKIKGEALKNFEFDRDARQAIYSAVSRINKRVRKATGGQIRWLLVVEDDMVIFNPAIPRR